MRLTLRSGVVVALTALTFAPLLAQDSTNSQAVIIEGWRPTEASGLDWAPPNRDTLDELWNDCALWYQLMYNRAVIAHDTSRIHMLWAQGSDYWRTGVRYGPQYIDTTLDRLTGDERKSIIWPEITCA